LRRRSQQRLAQSARLTGSSSEATTDRCVTQTNHRPASAGFFYQEITMKFNETQYYYQGYSSHQTGLPYESSPHPIGSSARLEWCRGWRDAENDYRKRLISNENDNTNQQFESLATRQDEGWNGEGLPPVGCECERETPRGWSRCKINYLSTKVVVYQMLESGNEYASTLSAYRFRPIRTEADRKREEAINEIASLIGRGTFCDDAAGIYDAIAAGKIPNIKLESPHE
jgi:ribosome modulation factor